MEGMNSEPVRSSDNLKGKAMSAHAGGLLVVPDVIPMTHRPRARVDEDPVCLNTLSNWEIYKVSPVGI